MQTWTAADEGPHPAGTELEWAETWTFDAADSADGWGITLRCSLLPAAGHCVVWGVLVHDDWGYLLVRDHDLGLPVSGGQVEVRGSLWAAALCEEPLARWTLGLESFGVRFGPDEVGEAWGREYGDVLALGFDLSFDDATAGRSGGDDLTIDTGYVRPGRVTGEVLVGDGGSVTSLALDAPGCRRHHWGVPRATSFSWAAGPDADTDADADAGSDTDTDADTDTDTDTDAGSDTDSGSDSGPGSRSERERAGGVHWIEHPETLPRDDRGMVRTDGRLMPVHQAPVRSHEPLPARVSRALGRNDAGAVGWLESWYPTDGR